MRRPYEKKKCLNCEKEFLYKNGNPYKKYCDNVCQNKYQNKNGLRTKEIPFSKELLEDLYLNKKLSVPKIALKLKTNKAQLYRFLKRLGIKTRPLKGMQPRLGAKLSLETRLKISIKHRGELNHTWKGGITPIHKKIRGGVKLKMWRKSILEKYNYTCQICGIKSDKGMEVDHIKPFALYPELRTDISNGRVLCNQCHRNTDSYGMRTTQLTKKLSK